MHWETLIETAGFCLRRSGRYLVTELLVPYRVLSTSACHGGQAEGIRYLVNHQSCEGSAHHERHNCLSELGMERYHHALCRERVLDASGNGRQHGDRGQHELCYRAAAGRRRGYGYVNRDRWSAGQRRLCWRPNYLAGDTGEAER